MHLTVIEDLLLAVALGLLIGLQREWSKSRVAGVRTFPLISLFGALAGGLATDFGGWTIGAGLLAVTAMLVVANVAKLRADTGGPGLTTEMSALVMYGVGASVSAGYVTPAIVTTGLVAVLLQFKEQLHGFVGRIEESDLRAGARLALIGLVILPALPNEAYGPFGVINPFRIWLMVVLIVGISLAAFVAYRLLGPKAGSWAAGLLGGLISSTATTATYAQSSGADSRSDRLSLAVIIMASTAVFLRVLGEIALVAPVSFAETAPPLVLMMMVMAGLAYVCHRRLAGALESPGAVGGPVGLRTAITFGLLYAFVLLAVAVAKTYFGDQGLFVVAAISGLTDMDAITLSTMELINTGGLETTTGWRLVLVAAMANLVFKGGMVATMGSRWLGRQVAGYFAAAIVAGGLILLFWTS